MAFTKTKAARNKALFADYLAGMSRAEVARKYGLSHSGACMLLHRERTRRFREAPRAPSTGRPPVWPDCPSHLADDYALIRRKGFSAAEARAMLEPGLQA